MTLELKNTEIFHAYNFSDTYNSSTISVLPGVNEKSYAQRLLRVKFDTLERYLNINSIIMDLGCANGVHLMSISDKIKQGIGIDFSSRFIEHALLSSNAKNISNLDFIVGAFDALTQENNTIDLVYSFSSLYHVTDDIEKVFWHVYRILKNEGVAILDLGNARSLNKIVADHTDGVAKLNAYNIEYQLSILSKYFTLLEHRSFQLLPMWGNKPWFLRPLLSRIFPIIFSKRIWGKMIDEWVSSLPIIRKFAFRHILVLRKK